MLYLSVITGRSPGILCHQASWSQGCSSIFKKSDETIWPPKVVVTDRLKSYRAAMNVIGNQATQDVGRWKNNRAEKSHLPFRRRERAMSKFRLERSLQKFSTIHSSVCNHFNFQRHLISRDEFIFIATLCTSVKYRTVTLQQPPCYPLMQAYAYRHSAMPEQSHFYGYAPVAKCFYSVPLAVFENDGLRDCRSYQAERFGCPVRQSKPGSNCSISRAQNNVICVRFRGPCINGLIISCSHSMVSRRARACSCAINVAYCASTGRATSRSQTLRPSR